MRKFIAGIIVLTCIGWAVHALGWDGTSQDNVYKMGWNCGVDVTKGADNGWCYDKGTANNRTSQNWLNGYSDEQSWVLQHTNADGNLDQPLNYK